MWKYSVEYSIERGNVYVFVGQTQLELDGTLARCFDSQTKVVANNVANVDTPYFKRSDVLFEELLQGEMNSSTPSIEGYRTNPKHFFIGKSTNLPNSEIKTDESTAINNNLNNVDMDYEMSLMAKTN